MSTRSQHVSTADLTWRADPLGEDFEQTTIPLGDDADGEGAIDATLVRHVVPASPVGTVVLYLHGFSDYFFHRQLSEHVAARGGVLYALDLRKSGRSRRPGQTAHYVGDLAFYDLELERAVAIIAEERPGARIVVVAHSTGGLIAPLWLARRGSATPPVAGLVLNSPWLDLQGSRLLRTAGTRAIGLLGRSRPYTVLPVGELDAYGRSLHSSTGGGWDFDLELKPLVGFPVTAGWLSAVRRGHQQLHRGLGLDTPTLVLHSDRSHFAARYSEQTDRADAVLDVAQIARWSPAIGSDVSVAVVPGARHDVFLSQDEPRAIAYTMLDAWLSSRGFLDGA